MPHYPTESKSGNAAICMDRKEFISRKRLLETLGLRKYTAGWQMLHPTRIEMQ